MRFYINILAAALLTAFSACVTSCSDNADSDTGVNIDEQYITVSIAIDNGATMTRSSGGPAGGEDGDGRQLGTTIENTVKSVTLLLYQSGTGINGTGSAKIEYAFYVDAFNTVDAVNGTYESKPVSMGLTMEELQALQNKTYHVIAVCNKDLRLLKGNTLSDARDYIVHDVWEGNAVSASDFVMSSEEDATITFDGNTGTGKETEPYYVTSSTTEHNTDNESLIVERLAARIDIDASKGTVGTVTYGGNTYDCVTFGSGTTTYHITHVIPANIQMGGTYLIKRTDDTTNPYLALEVAGKNSVRSPFWGNYSAGTYSSPDVSDSYKLKSNNADMTWTYAQENTFNTADVAAMPTYATSVRFIGYKEVSGVLSPYTYTYIIRHSDVDGTALNSDPMKYGIVRNNIYLITPDAENVEPDGLKIDLKVKKWSVHTHSVIYM